jgi:cation diffusion facilitator family transporter
VTPKTVQSENDHEHGHAHSHGSEEHTHPTGIKGFFYGLFVPHTHDAADSIDDALEASAQGVRALKISLFILLATTVLQLGVVIISGSVSLLADTIHNFSDALTAVPLWIAFVLGRRPASRRYTFGYGRAEDLAGLFIVVVVAASAIVAAWQSVERIINPRPIDNLWWVVAAGIIGFAGNEAVAIYRIRIGQRIGSAALVADGVHARTDGFTSLAVVVGAIGVMLGFPLADPIVGLVISATIIVLLWGTVRSVGRRLMDGIEPELLDKAEHALEHTPGVLAVPRLQLRWVGHRLHGTATIEVEGSTLDAAELVVREAEHQLGHALPTLDDMTISVISAERSSSVAHDHDHGHPEPHQHPHDHY